MKSISRLILVIIIAACVCKYRSKQKQKVKANLKQKVKAKLRASHKKARMTPKGTQLTDHYGANPYMNYYGPHPELVNRDAFIKNPDGTVARKRIRIIKNLPYSTSSCDITQKDNYYSCMNIRDCDLCSATEHCGWCEMQKLCLPGNSKESACPGSCINGWVFSKQSCDQIVRSGYLGNFDPQNTEKVQTVEYSYPKYKVDSIITTPEVVVTPLLLGTQVETHVKQQKSVEDDKHVVKDQTITVRKPIYGELRQVRSVNTHQTQYLDARTGLRVDHFGESNVAFHGVDEENIVSDPEDDYDPVNNLEDKKIFAKKQSAYYPPPIAKPTEQKPDGDQTGQSAPAS